MEKHAKQKKTCRETIKINSKGKAMQRILTKRLRTAQRRLRIILDLQCEKATSMKETEGAFKEEASKKTEKAKHS